MKKPDWHVQVREELAWLSDAIDWQDPRDRLGRRLHRRLTKLLRARAAAEGRLRRQLTGRKD